MGGEELSQFLQALLLQLHLTAVIKQDRLQQHCSRSASSAIAPSQVTVQLFASWNFLITVLLADTGGSKYTALTANQWGISNVQIR